MATTDIPKVLFEAITTAAAKWPEKMPNELVKALPKSIRNTHAVNSKTVRYVLDGLVGASDKEKSPPQKTQSSGMSKEQFAAKFDTKTRTLQHIKEGLKALAETASEEIIPDSEFRLNFCGNVSSTAWRQCAAQPEFHKYQFIHSRKIFWATPKTVQWALANVDGSRAFSPMLV